MANLFVQSIRSVEATLQWRYVPATWSVRMLREALQREALQRSQLSGAELPVLLQELLPVPRQPQARYHRAQ
jgi:hypothetical protein